MDWIKIYTKHFLNTKFTLLERGAFLTLQLLTAQLERIPSREEMLEQVSDKQLKAIADRLQGQCTTLAEVLQKVCEDVARVLHRRCSDTAKHQKSRTDPKNIDLSHGTPPPIDKIEKIEKIDNIYIVAKPPTLNKDFVNKFSELYKNETKADYHKASKDFIIAANLLNKYGWDQVEGKAKMLFIMCKEKSSWFTKGGMADFKIGSLSTHWNELLPERKEKTEKDESREFMEKLKERLAK